MDANRKLSDSLMEELPFLINKRASNTLVYQTKIIARDLKEYERLHKETLLVEDIDARDIIAFGYFIKDIRNLKNITVMGYLNRILSHLGNYEIQVTRKKVTKEFPFSQAKVPTLSEDIVDAILHTLVRGNMKHVLDAIKLVLLHGFRYSDLWVLEKGKCVFKTEQGIKYFKYFPPKNCNSINNKDGVVVAVHPIAEEIIDYWKDKKTRSTWIEARAPTGFKDKSIYPHIIYKKPRAIDGFYIFDRPIIKIPHYIFDKNMKKKIFEAVHKTWYLRNKELIKRKGIKGKKLKNKDILKMGLMADVPGTGKKLWESLTYHTFRHIYCSRYLTKGGNMLDLRDNVGHSSIAITQKYAHTVETERLERSFKIMNS